MFVKLRVSYSKVETWTVNRFDPGPCVIGKFTNNVLIYLLQFHNYVPSLGLVEVAVKKSDDPT